LFAQASLLLLDPQDRRSKVGMLQGFLIYSLGRIENRIVLDDADLQHGTVTHTLRIWFRTYSMITLKFIKSLMTSSIALCLVIAITEAQQRSRRSVIGLVIKIHYIKLLRASESTLSRWSTAFAIKHPLHFQGGLTSG
jgi:hypothetical protein